MFNKILCLVMVAMLLLASGCAKGAIENVSPFGDSINSVVEEYAKVEGYYTKLASDIYYEDGTLAALTYYVCLDEACTMAVGSKVVAFDEEGNFQKYETVIGMSVIEKMVTKEITTNGYSYTSITYDKDGYFIRGEFETVAYNSTTKVTSRSTGYQEYYNRNVLKTVHEEYYETPDGGVEKLVSTTDKSYSENGTLKDEKIVNY